MAVETQTFPVLTASTWWKLRKKFNATIPKELTPSYLSTALEMSENSAKTNVLPKLKLIGFVDENNKPTDLSIRWRDDSEYPDVCKELVIKLYPSELIDAIENPILNKNKVVKWFQSKARVGEKAALMMTAFYLLLTDANPLNSNGISQTRSEKPKVQPVVKESKSQRRAKDTIENVAVVKQIDTKPEANGFSPKIHLDIQIHISPDSSPDQIDKIFESMAKHLSGFKLQ